MKRKIGELGPCLLLVIFAGCQGEQERLRGEAQRFVGLYQQVDYQAPPKQRRAQLDALQQAVFVSPEVVAARALCVQGHRDLLDAQRVQDETAAEIDRALAGTHGAQPLPQDAIERLQKKLRESQGSLAKARTQLEQCEAQSRDLDLRFGKR